MKQTPVEWLVEQFDTFEFMYCDRNRIIEQAKELERQEIVMAFWNSKHSFCDEDTDLLYLAEEYYKAKFKQL